MVGPGTGIAPFRSFVESEGQRPMTLLFGCRGQETDYYFRDEWKQYGNLKVLEAFSREQGHKKYVQDVIREKAEYFADLIVNQKAWIYVSGRAQNMPESVEKAFMQAVSLHVDDPWNFVKAMKRNHLY